MIDRDDEILERQEELDGVPRRLELWWVAAYLTCISYGGPEEGGWWYNSGTLVLDVPLYAEIQMVPACFMTEQEAIDYSARMQQTLDQAYNRHRPRKSSVLSNGVYEALIYEGGLPDKYPEQRPLYE